MTFLLGLLGNKVLISAAAGWFLAQLSKILIDLFTGNFKLKRLVGGGGMPSSHSATVSSLATGAAFVSGSGSTEFVICVFLAMIVIYDAMNVRYQSGLHAKALNELIKREKAEGKDPIAEGDFETQMGHTLPEVIAGIAVGILAGCLACNFWPF